MESSSENSQECSIKIDTVWSEADESLLVKEEIVSDIEPDASTLGEENSEHHSDTQPEGEGNCNGHSDNQIQPSWQPFKKKVKTKGQKMEENDMIINHKFSCMHDTKNFKIVKRRLRCGDCRSLVCPECCKVMIPNLQSHFLGSGISNSGTYLCKLCSIIFHSLCALQAHIRIHTMDTPYVCPDCGLIYNNIYFLILHLLNKCYHVYKIVRYQCKQCPGKYFTPESFVQHIQESHIHCVFRCLYCSSLFNSYDEFNYHMENHHQKQKVQYLNYFRCSLCSNMVIPRFMYQRHVAQHRENSEYYKVDYQCLCGETYSLIGAFRSHFAYCTKKGVLPPKWSFLQRKLRTQDIVYLDNFQSKEIVIQTMPMYSNECDYITSSSIRPEKGNEDEKIENAETFVKSNCDSETPMRDVNTGLCNKNNEESVGSNKSNCTLEDSDKSKTTENAQSEECLNTETADDANCKNRTKESDQGDGDISKIYDHIPCDHLGYVIKTQCPEQGKKPGEGDDIIVEKTFSPGNYKFVTELDEKTGVITTKTVPIDELDIDEEDNTNEDDYDLESLNLNTTTTAAAPKPFCNDKSKFKINSLSCPFCVVLFPKHNLTFQQFRLHMESYHPDAALNITVCSTEDEAVEKMSADVMEIENPIQCRQEDVDDLSNSNLDSFQFSPQQSQDSSVIVETNDRNASAVGERVDQRDENWGGESSMVCDTVGQTDKTDNVESWMSEDCRVETVDTHTDDLGKTKEKSREPSEENMEVYTIEECVEENPGKRDSGCKSPKTISDLEYEGETSKDSNWSGTSGKDTRTNSPTESKIEEKERSRRESEVWSEFYESLMLAEKLKKKKNPSPDSDSKKKSVVSDYSAKRIVKKPMRYRQSSESADSNDYSESDDDFLLENEFMEKIYTDDNSEGQPNKKQMLMDKLENVDGKFLDYLFDLVTKKEKIFELYKKHSTLRASRYSHDLRSYRKKVLNGIKQRGRPLKILRYHELLKKKELTGEKNGKESYQLKKKSELSPDNKSNEKRRGRPRKYTDAAKLKERRRSDKEVDFIEKNFEREEPDLSPSKRKRKLSSKLQYYRKLSDEKDDFSSGQVITNKPVDSAKKFTCAVCKEVFPGLTEFRVHIVVHKMEENTYQCMECGECFVVRPSLEKHLHAFHKIKNTEKYIIENECCNVKKEVVEVEEEPLKENQCKVCKDQFDRAIDLTKHFRIHGMAFLKEFRKDGRSGEKRSV